MRKSALLHWVSFLLGVGAGGLVGGIQIEGNNPVMARIHERWKCERERVQGMVA